MENISERELIRIFQQAVRFECCRGLRWRGTRAIGAEAVLGTVGADANRKGFGFFADHCAGFGAALGFSLWFRVADDFAKYLRADSQTNCRTECGKEERENAVEENCRDR